MRESKLTRTERDFFHDIRMGAPRKGQGGLPDPLDFDIYFSHIITVAPRVEIQMHFWKGAKFAGSVGHPMTKMLSASWGLRPPERALSPDPRYRLVLRTRHGAPQPLTPSAAYDPPGKKSCGRPWPPPAGAGAACNWYYCAQFI